MMNRLRLKFLLLLFITTTLSSVGQDILHLKDGSEKRIIFDAIDYKSITYRDYDDPDFKLITEQKKPYAKIVLANGKTVWITQRDNYFRCKVAINLGVVTPLGDFASDDNSNVNAGFATEPGTQFSGTFDVNIYKFVGLRLMGYGTLAKVYTESTDNEPSYENGWTDLGFAIGPEFHIKLSPRFYASVPILYQRKKMNSEYYESTTDGFNYSNSTTEGDGTGGGFITGLGLHARLGQHFAIGWTTQYFKQNMSMTYNSSGYISSIGNVFNSYTSDYKWAYLSNTLTCTLHF